MIVKSLTFLIKLYQRYISPCFPQTCRFYPSCSEYACESLVKHGLLKGSWYAIKRLVRCNPFNPGGYDPVPNPNEIGREPA